MDLWADEDFGLAWESSDDLNEEVLEDRYVFNNENKKKNSQNENIIFNIKNSSKNIKKYTDKIDLNCDRCVNGLKNDEPFNIETKQTLNEKFIISSNFDSKFNSNLASNFNKNSFQSSFKTARQLSNKNSIIFYMTKKKKDDYNKNISISKENNKLNNSSNSNELNDFQTNEKDIPSTFFEINNLFTNSPTSLIMNFAEIKKQKSIICEANNTNSQINHIKTSNCKNISFSKNYNISSTFDVESSINNESKQLIKNSFHSSTLNKKKVGSTTSNTNDLVNQNDTTVNYKNNCEIKNQIKVQNTNEANNFVSSESCKLLLSSNKKEKFKNNIESISFHDEFLHFKKSLRNKKMKEYEKRKLTKNFKKNMNKEEILLQIKNNKTPICSELFSTIFLDSIPIPLWIQSHINNFIKE